ncbi:MAG: HNH endonuclease [Rhodospirillales bacterium]|nr:MAG: HNH endonuclease [Rhodospirillales bacterium]
MAKWPYNTSTWKALRASKLRDAPLCQPCQQVGRLVPASVVDHNTPVNKGGAPFPPLDGLTSMCPACHSRKTAQEDGLGRAATTRRRGRGVDPETGKPIDKRHWWNGGAR